MRRGEVWWVDFDPAKGGEIRKVRPAVIVSNDLANAHLNRLQVLPLTTRLGTLDKADIKVVERVIKIQLGLPL